MTTAHIIAGDLRANLSDRVVSGILVPFGEVGSTNLGKFSIDGPGIITIPKDVSVLNVNEDHDQLEPRARFLSVTETPAGMFATFKMGENPEGDRLLAAIDAGAANGKPKSLSVEIKGMRIAAGKGISGLLAGAAFLDRGAFPSARLLAAAVDTEEEDPLAPPADPAATAEPTETTEEISETFTDEAGVEHIRTTTTVTKIDGETTTTTITIVVTEPEPTPESEPSTVAVPNTLKASHNSGPAQISKREVFSILSSIHTGTADESMLARVAGAGGSSGSSLFAALSDIKYDGAGGIAPVMGQPQWIGELWNGLTYEQQIAPLFGAAPLTGLKIDGWRWTKKPTGGTWTGNKTAIPSDTVSVEPYTTSAKRWAGGHDHAREHVDFGTPGYFESYYAAMTESYAQWVDETIALADVLAAATATVADNPAGLTIGSGLSALIDGAAEVIAAKAVPSFALVDLALWKQIAKTPQNATLGYLSAALGLKEGSLEGFVIRPTTLIGTGNILVGAREAATVYQLGGVPIRAEAADLVRGGVDTGLFGYAGTVIHKPSALVKMTPFGAA